MTVKGLSLHGGGNFSGNGTGSGNIDIQSGAGTVIEGNVIGATATSYTNPGGAAQTQNNLIRMTGGSDITVRNNLLGFTRWRSILMFSPVADVTHRRQRIHGVLRRNRLQQPGLRSRWNHYRHAKPLSRFRRQRVGSSHLRNLPDPERRKHDRHGQHVRHGGLRHDRRSAVPASREEQRDDQRDPGRQRPHPGTPPSPATITQNSIFDNSDHRHRLARQRRHAQRRRRRRRGPQRPAELSRSSRPSSIRGLRRERAPGSSGASTGRRRRPSTWSSSPTPPARAFRGSSSRVRPTSPPSK